MKREEFSARLLVTFLGELDEQLELMNAELLRLESAGADAERLKSLFRIAHTLKGAARAVQAKQVERVCHSLEAMLERARASTAGVDAAELNLLFSAADVLAEAGQQLRVGAEIDDAKVNSLVTALKSGVRDQPSEQKASATRGDARQVTPAPAESTTELFAPQSARTADRYIRVDPNRLDQLLASTARLDTAKASLAERSSQLRRVEEIAARAAKQGRALSRRLRVLETGNRAFEDELLAVADELQVLNDLAGRLADSSARSIGALDQATTDVSTNARQLRMRPFAEACEALPRAVRDLTAMVGKDVRLDIRGGDVEADRAVLDGVREAILQLIRNAVDHGIEPPNVREERGKSRTGHIEVVAALSGDRLTVRVADDGAGLDLPAIRTRLEQTGRAAPQSDDDLASVLFEGGVSTRIQADAISGRGVGLDVVRDAVEKIRGSVSVSWEAGRGTTFVLTCPPTLATVRVVIVSVGGHLLAIPTDAVERLARVAATDIRTAEGRAMLPTAQGPVPVVLLARLLPPLAEQTQDPLPVIILSAAGRRLAFAVDELVAEQEIVLRPLHEFAEPTEHVSGAALLGPGRVVLVLNPGSLIAAATSEPVSVSQALAHYQSAAVARTILVVDDSITTRTLEQSILATAGYRVLTAVDGADGWRILQKQGADLVVADVEMPRMDGFALCAAIRGSKRFRDIPVVLVTALETPEHRARGLDAGADAYIAKSGFDQQSLLDAIKQLIG